MTPEQQSQLLWALAGAWAWLVHAAQAFWASFVATLDLIWRTIAPIGLSIDGAVFWGSFLAMLFDGEMILAGTYSYWRKNKVWPTLDSKEMVVFVFSSFVALVAAGYVAYYALRMVLAIGAAFFLATVVRREAQKRKKAEKA